MDVIVVVAAALENCQVTFGARFQQVDKWKRLHPGTSLLSPSPLALLRLIVGRRRLL